MKTHNLSEAYKEVQALKDLNLTVKQHPIFGIPKGTGPRITVATPLDGEKSTSSLDRRPDTHLVATTPTRSASAAPSNVSSRISSGKSWSMTLTTGQSNIFRLDRVRGSSGSVSYPGSFGPDTHPGWSAPHTRARVDARHPAHPGLTLAW